MTARTRRAAGGRNDGSNPPCGGRRNDDSGVNGGWMVRVSCITSLPNINPDGGIVDNDPNTKAAGENIENVYTVPVSRINIKSKQMDELIHILSILVSR